MRVELVEWDGRDAGAIAARMRAAAPRPEGLGAHVRDVVDAVRAGGDRAVVDLGERFDGVRVAKSKAGSMSSVDPFGFRIGLSAL